MNNKQYFKKLTENKKAPTDSGRSHTFGQVGSFDGLSFMTAQLKKRAVDYFTEGAKINSKVTIGQKTKHPIEIDGPAIVAAMSFGALSKTAKLAIAKGSSLAKTIDNTGEGGMLPEQRQFADLLIAQYSTGRFGVDDDYLKKADVVEIKIGQGAKPGQGGLLPGHKVTAEIAKTRSSKIKTVKEGEAVHSPPAHPDIFTTEDLKNRIDEIRKLIDGKPIILKLGACNLLEDLPLAVEAGPDIIAIDGSEGGTGASPAVMLHHTGIPTLAALAEARYILDKLKATQELWIGGGITCGADMAKALAMGADMVFIGSALMEALGCTRCGLCHTGKCPSGIATQEPELEKRLDVEEGAKGVANFFNSCREEVRMITAACGHNDIYKLNKKDLISLNSETKKITGIPMAGIKRAKKHFEK